MRLFLSLILIVPLALACRPRAAGSTPDAGVEVVCATNQDCAAALDGGNCVSGFCVICVLDADCPAGESCTAGSCATPLPDGGAHGDGGGGSGGGDGGLPVGQCLSSCNSGPSGGPCPSSGLACISGRCEAPPATCQRNNDCSCVDTCAGGSCVLKCKQNSDCPAATPSCYLPQGLCGACENSQQCSTGSSCNGGICSGDGGSCNASHCCNNGDCPRASPVCSAGACGPCSSSFQCSQGYSCVSGACEAQTDAGTQCGVGCTGGLVCDPTSGQCVPSQCNPACGPPATCDPTTNGCVCPANCGTTCPSGTTCDTTSCQCQPTSTGGSSGGIGGFPSTCTSKCTGCPAGQTCGCPGNDVCGPTSTCLLFGGFCQ